METYKVVVHFEDGSSEVVFNGDYDTAKNIKHLLGVCPTYCSKTGSIKKIKKAVIEEV